jgi:septal ring factor EnvC (AmiA/AmiB activator)
MTRCFAFLVLLMSFAVAAEPAPTKELDAVRGQIDDLSAQRALAKKSQEELYAQLREQSLKVSDINRALQETEKQIQSQDQQLRNLQDQLGIQQAEQQKQLEALYSQLRASFMHAQPSYLKILLNQQDPALVSRNATYYRYFHAARQEQIAELDTLLSNLTEEQKAVFAAQRTLEDTLEKQQQQQQALASETAQRQNTLAALDQKIASQDQQLEQLQSQEQELQALLDELSRQAKIAEQKAKAAQQAQQARKTERSAPQKPTTAFASQSGKLLWPLRGKLLAHYGEPRNLDKLSWKGIIIASETGNNVVASASGRVVFADWLRGFGLLIIIDHGDQFMSLYANNNSLLKSVGDQVSAGDVIAHSGDRGVRQTAGLYFEIRHRGSPTDPLKWLQKQS